MKLEKDNVADILPLSPVQEGILFHHLQQPESGAYFQQTVLSVTGELDQTALQEALNRVVAAHESLRSVFRWEGLNKPVQVILKKSPQTIKFFDQTINTSDLLAGDSDEGVGIETAPWRLQVISHSAQAHTFIFSFHHLLLDGWSFGLLIKNLLSQYHAICTGQTAPVGAPTVGGLKSHLGYVKNRHTADEARYWQARMQSYQTPAELPYHQIRSAQGAAKTSLAISSKLMEQIQQISRERHVSVASVFYAAWALLIHKASGQQAVTFGTTSSGRPKEVQHIQETIGMFINTLPFQVDLAAVNTVEALLQAVQEQAISLMDYEFASLTEIKNYAGIDGSEPLFNALCVVENYPLYFDEQNGGLQVTGSEVFENTNYVITLGILPFDLEHGLHFSYKQDYFTERDINQLGQHLLQVLEAIVTGPEMLISEVDILDAATARQMLEAHNQTDEHYAGATTMQQYLRQGAAAHPDKTALSFGQETLSYAALDQCSDRLSARLIAQGVTAQSVVGVNMDRSLELLISIFAIFKAGAIYLPIDPTLPQDRVQYIIEDSQAALVLLRQEGPALTVSAKTVAVSCEELKQDKPVQDLPARDKADAPAYIIYTSGSTGKPKGVQVKHQSLTNSLHWARQHYTTTPDDVFMQKTPIVFDVSLWELFWWVVEGASLHILQPGAEKEVDTMVNAIEEHQVTRMFFVPSLLRTFTLYVQELGLVQQINSLRHVIASGEELKTTDISRFYQLFDEEREISLSNLYGPTEATVHVTWFDCPRGEEISPVPIGKPIGNTRMYVLNGDMQAQPEGLAGELYIGGICVAEGYINKPELTATRFVPNPFGEGKLYKTGDLAKWSAAGELLYLGRIDNQVKVRGYRIELGEIAARLHAQNHIAEAEVLVTEDASGEPRIEAFYTAPTAQDQAALRSGLEQVLPAYMVPDRFHWLAQMPLTHNGKVDKKALKKWAASQQSKPVTASVADISDEVLARLVAICAEVLGQEGITPADNFFRVGGDSIKAIRLLSLLRKEGFNLQMRDILENPVLQELALLIKNLKEAAKQEAYTGEVGINAIQAAFFDTDAQQVHQYNQAVVLHLRKQTETTQLQAVVEVLTSTHDAFRLQLTGAGQQSQVRIADNTPSYELIQTDLRGDSNKAYKTAIDALHAGLHIYDGPLARFAHILTDAGAQLVIVMHHLITDGVSWRILLEDIDTLLSQQHAGKELMLDTPATPFGNYLVALHEQVAAGQFEAEQDYWSQLGSQKVDTLFTGQSWIYNHAEFSRKQLTVGQELQTQIEQINSRLHTNTNEVLLAALGLAVKNVFEVESLAVNLEGHGRTDLAPALDLSRTVGWFTSLYPVVIDARHKDDPVMYLRTVKETVKSVPNNGEGYGIIKYLAQADLREGKAQMSFNYLGDFSAQTEATHFSAEMEATGNWYAPKRKVQHPLEVFAMPDANQNLTLTADFIAELATASQIDELLKQVVANVERIAKAALALAQNLKTPSDLSYSSISLEALDALQLQPAGLSDIYELSPTQQGLLHHCEQSSDGAYVVDSALYLEGALSVTHLEEAFQQLVSRHDILRTVIWEDPQALQTMQLVKAKGEVALQVADARIEERKTVYIDQLKEQGRHEVGHLHNATPNIRLTLVRLEEEQYALLFFYHHILLDGWSVVMLLHELFQTYRLLSAGQEPATQLESVPSYGYYIKWLRNHGTAAAADFWKKYLYEHKEPFQFEQERLSAKAKEDGHIIRHLDKTVFAAINTFVQGAEATLYHYLQSSWALLLSQLSGSNDLVFGQVVSGRPAIEAVDQLLGLFINTVPKRVRIDEQQTFVRLVAQVAQDETQSAAHQYYPLADILAKTKLRDQTFSHIVVFENQYQLLDLVQQHLGETLRITGYEGNDPNQYPVSVFFSEAASSLKIELRYDRHQYEAAYFEQILDDFEALLADLATNSDKRIEDIFVDATGEMDLPAFM